MIIGYWRVLLGGLSIGLGSVGGSSDLLGCYRAPLGGSNSLSGGTEVPLGGSCNHLGCSRCPIGG